MHKLMAVVFAGALLAPTLVVPAEASGGCGPYRHRGPYGGCRPNGQFGFRGYGGFHRNYHYNYHYHYHYNHRR